MHDGHHGRTTDLGLRLLGVLLCAASWLAIRALIERHVYGVATGADYALAATGFVCGGAGAALGLLGRHLFDEVAVSERWRRYPTSE